KLIKAEHCAPLMLRLSWADAGTFQASVAAAAAKGGGGGGRSVRFGEELDYPCNKGLSLAVSLLQPLADTFTLVSSADLFQIAGALAVHECGGPWVPIRVGRLQDTDGEESVSEAASERRECAKAPFPDAAPSAAAHLKAVFGGLGLSPSDSVALMGAHTLGRAHASRSGHAPASTPYTKAGPGRTRGGASWTKEWQVFDNSYFKASSLTPKPSILNPEPYTLNPDPYTLNPKP
ncbi:heme peroxidase, partial [Baffinella frigidus]